jgi:hypothetical protein
VIVVGILVKLSAEFELSSDFCANNVFLSGPLGINDEKASLVAVSERAAASCESDPANLVLRVFPNDLLPASDLDYLDALAPGSAVGRGMLLS